MVLLSFFLLLFIIFTMKLELVCISKVSYGIFKSKNIQASNVVLRIRFEKKTNFIQHFRNQFYVIPKDFRALADKAQPETFLLRNQFYCDCNSKEFITWLRSTKSVRLRCSVGRDGLGHIFNSLIWPSKRSEFRPNLHTPSSAGSA